MSYTYLKVLLLFLGAVVLFGSSIKILKEFERGVIFRLGKYLSTKGPGLILLIPLVDRITKVDLRLVSIDVPRQDIMTRDNVPATVDAVVYFHVVDPAKAIINIKDIYQSTFLLAQATLRNVLGQVELDDLLSQQGKINQQLQEIIAVHTKNWGIDISIVEIKEVSLPEKMKRAMAKQAETERERRARLIDAQGEYQASKTLADAGKILSESPQGLQLRYLQTLRDISTNKGSTVLFPFPMDLLSPFVDGVKKVFSREDTHAVKIDQKGEKPEKQEIKTENTTDSTRVRVIEDRITEYQDRLSKGTLMPTYVQWVTTNRCQFRCAHCETPFTKADSHELDTSEAKRLIDDLVDMGCETLSLTGGEPLLREDIFEIAGYAKKSGLRLVLTTNGMAIEENLVAISEMKPDSVVITLDGYGETQNKIRECKDAYDKGLKSIEFFHDIGIQGICVSTILLEDNLKGFPSLTEDIFRAGANQLQIQPLIFKDGLPMRNSSQTIKDAFRFILEARRRGFPVEAGEQFGYLGPLEPMLHTTPFFCGSGWNNFCITSEGKVQGCPLLIVNGVDEGDFKIQSLQDIWQKGFSILRKAIPEDLPDGCKRCPHISLCRGGCWLFRAVGLNPCFLLEAEQVYQEIQDAALYNQTP